MNNNPSENKFDFDSLFKEVTMITEVELSLPSKNKFYKTDKIMLRPMTFEDEKSIVTNKKSGEDSVNLLLSRCISNIDIKNILLMDKLFILMKLREISYKEEYNATLGCQSCSKENHLIFKLDDLNINYLPDDIEEFREIELPKSKVKVKIKFPKIADEIYFKNENALVNNLWRFIVSVNGTQDTTIISKFVQDSRLPLQDLHFLMQETFKTDFGLSTKIKYNCDSCSYVNIDELPITSNFFSMN